VPSQYVSLIRDELKDQALSLQDEVEDLRDIADKGEEPPSGYSLQQTEDKTDRLLAMVRSFDSETPKGGRVLRGDREGIAEILFKAISNVADRLSQKVEPLHGILTAEVRKNVDTLEWLTASLEQIGVEER
jgi:hypothetical protein